VIKIPGGAICRIAARGISELPHRQPCSSGGQHIVIHAFERVKGRFGSR
jgi:hypothetical protein